MQKGKPLTSLSSNHRPPNGLHALTVLDDETIDWLLNI